MKVTDLPVQIANWHLEISSKCVLKCSRCTRTIHSDLFQPKELSLDLIKKVFSDPLLKGVVKRVTFSGGLGDPIYHSNFIEIVSFLKGTFSNLQLVIVTNGSFRNEDWWKALTEKLDHNDEVIFSIDGWDHESNNLYRKGSDWNSILSGLKIVSKSKVLVRWSTIVFKFNQENLGKIRKLAEESGADLFHLVLSDRFGSKYVSGAIDDLQPSEKYLSKIERPLQIKQKFSSGKDKFEKQRSLLKEITLEFKKRRSLTLEEFKGSWVVPSCRFGYRGVYVDVDGFFYPCSWVAHPYSVKKSKITSRNQNYGEGFERYRDFLNLNQYSLSEIFENKFWSEWMATWRSQDSADLICESKCSNREEANTESVTFDQWIQSNA